LERQAPPSARARQVLIPITGHQRSGPGHAALAPRHEAFAVTRLLLSLFGNPAALLVAPMILFVFAWYFFLPAVLQTEPDYWWHVRTGQYIVESGSLPRTDIYSYTVAGQPWVTHEWLTEVLLFSVQRHLGYVGNVALFGLVGAATALAVYATCRRRGLGEVASTILMLWAATMALGSANVRAQGLTTLLLAASALLLTRYKQGHRRALWLLPPLLAVWVNLHGGYLIGLVLLGLTITGEAAARLLGRPAAPLRPLLLVTLLSAAATLLSPHGLEALLYPFSYASTETAMMQYIAEWQSPDFHRPYLLIFAASLLLGLLLGLGRRPLGPTECLWALALTLMALQSVRHIALYAVVITPLLGARLQEEVPAMRRSLASWRRPALLSVTWLLLAMSLLRMSGTTEQSGGLQLGWEPDESTYPAGATELLRTLDLRGNLFNSYDWGGYLIYKLHPERRVFIDGRTDVYNRFVGRYMEVALLRPTWREVLDEHDVQLVLVEKDSPLAVVLGDNADWQEVYEGQVERLFVRRGIFP
jgi:hypothetical protein